MEKLTTPAQGMQLLNAPRGLAIVYHMADYGSGQCVTPGGNCCAAIASNTR